MQRPYMNRSVQNRIQIQGQNRYKQLSYVNHQQKYPLQLKGNMKRYSQPEISHTIKSIINYDAYDPNKSHNYTDQNCQNRQNRQNNRNSRNYIKGNSQNSALAQKILTNNKLANSTYDTSILPQSDPRSSKIRPQSVKTYKQERQGTGLNYIMKTEQKYLYKQPEKRHIQEYHVPKRQTYGKKCNLSATKQNQSSQLVYCLNECLPNQTVDKFGQLQNSNKKSTNISSIFNVIHPTTTNKRIANDIHSSFSKKQSEDQVLPTKSRFESQNQFKTGIQLGYEYKKSKQIGSQKVMQMMGSEYHDGRKNNQQQSLRQKRDDWRRSTIVIQ